MELLRDPSHVRAMPLAELAGLFTAAGLPEPRATTDRLEAEMEGLISRSFPKPGDDEALRRIFRASLPDDALGMNARLVNEEILVGYPVAVLAARKA